MDNESQFILLSGVLAVAVFLLFNWHTGRSNNGARYTPIRRSASHDQRPDGYPAGRQGAAFQANQKGRFEEFKGDSELIPVHSPSGVWDPALSLARQQHEASMEELAQLNFIKSQQTQTAQNLLPRELSADVARLTDRNFLLSNNIMGTDTRGASLKNPSLDIRKPIAIQRTPVSIWSNSNYDPEPPRRPLE